MRCESVQSALVDGRPLSLVDDAHLADCAACARVVATLGAWEARRLPERDALPVPSMTALQRGVRGQRLREVGVATAAVLLVGLGLPIAWTPVASPPPPPAPLVAASADTGPALVADDVIAAAVPQSEADEALLLALVSLDRLEAPADALPDADILRLLDPYDTDPEPLITLGDL
ncbi:MAG: hypothetical protein EXR71_03450 [Myxococcales bacterium]|nr:hypothetical protein [Myxococcales bacterium]